MSLRRFEKLNQEKAEAVKEYEYMTKVSQQPFDFFVASSERYHDDYVPEKAIRKRSKDLSDFADPPHMTYEDMKHHALPTGPWKNDRNPEPLGGTRNASVKALLRRNFWWRASGALVGGAFLVGLMRLLVLRRELYVHLGAATGFVSAFGFLMVCYMDQLEHVFASTPAYATVLMVFVAVMLDKQFP